MRARYKVHMTFAYSPIAKVVLIIDEATPQNALVSITSDAEEVCKRVNKEYPHHRIYYKDSLGNWDELLHNGGWFVGFRIIPDDEVAYIETL